MSPDNTEYTLFSGVRAVSTRIDHIIDQKEKVNKFQIIEIILGAFSGGYVLKQATIKTKP